MVSATRNSLATACSRAYSRLDGLSWRTVFTLPGLLAAIACFSAGLGAFWLAFIYWIYPTFVFPAIFGCPMR